MKLHTPNLMGGVKDAIALGHALFGDKEGETPTSASTNKKNGAAARKEDALADKYSAEADSTRAKMPREVEKLGAQVGSERAKGRKYDAEAADADSSTRARDAKLPHEVEKLGAEIGDKRASAKKKEEETRKLAIERRKQATTSAITGFYDAAMSLPAGASGEELNRLVSHYQGVIDDEGEMFDLAATLSGDGGFSAAHRMTEMIDDIRRMQNAGTYEGGNRTWREEDGMRTEKLQGYKDEALSILQNDPHIQRMIDRGNGGRKVLSDIVPGSEISDSLPDDHLYVELEVTRPDGSVSYELMTMNRGTKEEGDDRAKPVALRDIQQHFYGQQKIASALEPFRKVLQRRQQEGYYSATTDPTTHQSNLRLGENLITKGIDTRNTLEGEATGRYQQQVDALMESGLGALRQARAAEQAGGEKMGDDDRAALLAMENQLDDLEAEHQLGMLSAQRRGATYLQAADKVRDGQAKPPTASLGSAAFSSTAPATAAPAPAVNTVTPTQRATGSLSSMVAQTMANHPDQPPVSEAPTAQVAPAADDEGADQALHGLQGIVHSTDAGLSEGDARAKIRELNRIYELAKSNPALMSKLVSRTGAKTVEQFFRELMARLMKQAGIRGG